MSRRVHETYNDPKADLGLISSDHVIFLVHKVQIAAESPVSKKLIEQEDFKQSPEGDRTEVILCETLIETSDVIECFLSVLLGADFPKDHEITWEDRYFKLRFDFAEKYKCNHYMRTLLQRLHQCANTDVETWSSLLDPMTIFILAARQKANDICAAVISGPHGEEKWDVDLVFGERVSSGGYMLEPSAGPEEYRNIIPWPHSWCLARAMSRRKDEPAERDRYWAAQEFLDLLKDFD